MDKAKQRENNKQKKKFGSLKIKVWVDHQAYDCIQVSFLPS